MVVISEVRISGVVADFDDPRGLGHILADGTVYPFHCVSIADGSRSIAVGDHVSFVALAKLGRHEAGDIRSR
jgi:cold shock CspA family protein